MARNILKISTLALMAAASTLSAAHAGGFARGTADTDILYEDGSFNIRAGATVIAPTRKFVKAFAPLGGSLVGKSAYDTYVIPSAALKLNINDDLRCATTYNQSFGGDTSYAVPFGTLAKLSENLAVDEFALTCGYKMGLSTGQAWLLGGVAQNNISYGLVAGGGSRVFSLNDTKTSFRVGASYEIPEFALRVQAMYVSGYKINASGTALVLPVNVTLPATGAGEVPQSFEIKAQSGIAPDWLAFGSVKWTDWSVTKQLILTSAAIGGSRANNYFYRDGWTVNGGVGHKFSDNFSGAVSITWDRGTGTGYDTASDTWTVGAGGALKDKLGGELKFGAGITYIAGASETKYAAPLNTVVKSGVAYAFGASYKTKW